VAAIAGLLPSVLRLRRHELGPSSAAGLFDVHRCHELAELRELNDNTLQAAVDR
jgi:hypothetical protein